MASGISGVEGKENKESSKDKCGDCGQIVSDKEKAVECEICECWYHAKCHGISADTYKAVNKNQDLHWYCKSCGKALAKLRNLIAIMETRQEKIENEVAEIGKQLEKVKEDISETRKEVENKLKSMEEKSKRIVNEESTRKQEEMKRLMEAEKQENLNCLQNEVQNLSKKITETMKVEIDKIKNELQERQDKLEKQVEKEEIEKLTKAFLEDGSWTEVVKKDIKGRIENIETEIDSVHKVLDERQKQTENDKEREKRKNGVVLFNIPEDENAKSYTDQADKDVTFICDMMSYILEDNCDANEFNKIRRLGKRDYRQPLDTTVYSRPVLVEFTHGMTKNYVMQNLGRLKTADDIFKKVIVNHDMTEMDRAEIKKLVQEAKEKEEREGSGEWTYKVRGQPGQMRIIKLKKRQN